MKYVYGQRWHPTRNQPTEALDEAEAMARFNGERSKPDWFTVAAFVEDATPEQVPEFYAEITPHGAYAAVYFIDPFGSIHYIFGFRKTGKQLFLEDITAYAYPDMTKHYNQNECAKVVSMYYKTDGVVEVETIDKSQPDISVVHSKDVDVSAHWEPIPAFGDWESLGRFDARWKPLS
ncbi:hypothetical protein [Arthrobacter sp. NA-172]|uniref:hypothetical protein n=1 Tax=Arthrobacter sp. NA-172 TaxID=3367524 RepID=UPI00375445BB